jgi:hypothetical protein
LSSIAEAQKVLALQREIEDLKARVEVLERLGSFVDEAEPIRRGPGRPKKQPQVAPEA